MTNPYQSPAIAPGTAWTATDLSQLAPLRSQIRVLRIIVFSLAAGIVAFGVDTIVHNWGQPQAFAGKLDLAGIVMIVVGLFLGLQGIILPGMLFRIIKPNAAMVSQFAAYSPEMASVLMIQHRIQTATIIGCALFEGGAFANLFWYFTRADLLHLAVASLLLLGILARFPLPGACERRIEDELRREREEASIKR